MSSLSHLTTCTPTKSVLHIANTLETVLSKHDLHSFLTFRLPNLVYIFLWLSLSRYSSSGTQCNNCYMLAVLRCEVVSPHFKFRKWDSTPCRLSASTYSVYSYVPHVDRRIILRWIFRKWEGVVGTGWSWIRIGRGGGHLWVR